MTPSKFWPLAAALAGIIALGIYDTTRAASPSRTASASHTNPSPNRNPPTDRWSGIAPLLAHAGCHCASWCRRNWVAASTSAPKPVAV